MSPRKVRLVADTIRGLSVKSAEEQLTFRNKRAAKPLLKLLKSVLTNAEHNFKLKKDNLYVKEIKVDEGPTLKRWLPRAMGRATPINKRTSHVLLVLDEKEGKEIKSARGESQFGPRKLREEKEKKNKRDEDVRVVKTLDEVKEIGKSEKIKSKEKATSGEEHKTEIEDVRREASGREKQHLDKMRRKDKGGILKRMFRRKSI